MTSKLRKGKAETGAKFADYFDFAEGPAKLPSHRVLALFRGEKEEVLDLSLEPEAEPASAKAPSAAELAVMNRFGVASRGRPGDALLVETVRQAWRGKMLPRLATDLRTRLWDAAEAEAVRIFATNLRDLLLAAPAGPRPTLGLDPGFRSGVKVAVVDRTGKVAATATIYPHEPQRRWDEAVAILDRLVRQHGVELLAIGNGTASRETDRLATEVVRRHPDLRLRQGRGVGGRRLGLFGLGLRVRGTAGTRRHPARRGVDRPQAAGPLGRTREDRPEVDRRRAVPTRSRCRAALALARRGGRGLRQRGGGRRQHGLGAASGTRLGGRSGSRPQHRAAPGRPWRFRDRARR